MVLFISHSTAAECWRSGRFDAALGGSSTAKRLRLAGSTQVEELASSIALNRLDIVLGEALVFGGARVREAAKLKPNARSIRALREGPLSFASEPLHVIVPDRSVANSIQGLECHVRADALPAGSFVRISEGLLACSPELSFLSMATLLPFPFLVKLGYELCALYTMQPDGTAGYERAMPPTTVHAMDAYLGRCSGMNGVAAARRALRFIAGCSRSPMETALAIVLCLPPRLGGYGLPVPRMNHRIDASGNGQASFAKSYYLCDLCWPQAKVAVEYDSDLEHTGASRIAADAQRRNDLADLGVTTITATREQVMSADGLERLAHQLRRRLHVRTRSEREPDPRERVCLLRSLVTAKDLEASVAKTRKVVVPAEER